MLIACKGCGAWWVMPPLPQPADNPDPDPFDTAIEEVEPEAEELTAETDTEANAKE